MKYILHFFLLTFLIFSFSNTYSQSGKIAGKVIDGSTKEVLPFVNIIIVGTSLGAQSNLDGEYFILNIPPGKYTIKASAIGFNSITTENINVSSGFTTNLDLSLTSTAVQYSQDVVVIATKPLVQKDLTASTSTVGEDVISKLPVTEISDVLSLQAGVVTSGADIHMRGGRKGQIGFQIDGVPVTDSYDGSTVIDVAADAVKELQVISGAFNAEYGQAMSGIVNIVTKDGDNDFRGSLTSYAGDYVSNKNSTFWNISNVNPTAIRSFEGSLSGPVIKDKLFFYTNGRYYYNTGYLYGKRLYLPTDRAIEVPNTNGTLFNISTSGDSSYVPMNPNERVYGQGKLTYRLMDALKLSFNYILDRQRYKDYNHDRMLTPDNNLQRFRKGITNTLSVNHAISKASFYTLNFSYFFKEYHDYLYGEDYNTPIFGEYRSNDPNKPTPYVDNFIHQTPPYYFEVGGTDYERFNRFTSTYSAKLDWTTQLNQEINIQFGGEFKKNALYYHKITLYPFDQGKGLQMAVFPLSSLNNDEYLHKPTETSAYVQSKFEAFNLIFNVGVRLDAFDPDGVVLTDPEDPNISNPLKPDNQFHDLNGDGKLEPEIGETPKTEAERRASNALGQPWFKKATVKYQLSPRIGLAFPITDKGVIHFSYGHFLQTPSYELMYANPEFELGSGSGNQGLFGNADLKPQKTVKGEIGLQQQIGGDMALDVTVFFEDFRDLTGTQTDEILVFGRGSSYSKYANSDFGFSKGFIIRFEKRFSGGLATSIDYTYSVTKGNASNPADARDALTKGALPETFIAPLNWDQTHTLNLSVSYSKPRDYGFSLIGNFYTGQPYTPAVNKDTRVTQNAFPRNSEIKPTTFNIDLRLYKDIPIGVTTISVFMKVFNLLDLNNPTNVFTNSGDPKFTFDELDAKKVNLPTYNGISLDDFYNHPEYYSEPRRVEFGVSYNF